MISSPEPLEQEPQTPGRPQDGLHSPPHHLTSFSGSFTPASFSTAPRTPPESTTRPPSMKRRMHVLSAALTANLAPAPRLVSGGVARRRISSSAALCEGTGCREGSDPRDLGRRILDDFAYLKEQYCKSRSGLAPRSLLSLTRHLTSNPSSSRYPPLPLQLKPRVTSKS